MKNYFIIFNLFFVNFFVGQSNIIDSLLESVQNQKINEALAIKAVGLPYDKIVNNLNKSYSLFQLISESNVLIKNNQKLAELYEQFALVSYLKGKYPESFELHKKSIELFELTNDKRQKAMAMASMAYQSKKRNLNNSIAVMRDAIQILRENNFNSDLPAVIDNYGVLFELKGDLDSALFYYKTALQLKEKAGDSLGIPYSLNNVAGIYFMQGKHEEGLKIMNESNFIRRKLNDFIGIAWNEYSLGEMYIRDKRYFDAEPHVRNSLSLSINNSYPDLISKNAKFLANIFSKQNKYDSAYFYFNLFHELNDSIYNANKQNQLLEMESIYESEKKSFQIKALNDENILKENEIEKKRNTLYFFIILSFILVFAGIVIYRAYNQKNKANIIINEQKKEVELQKQIIEEKQKEILDSIHYAKRIQETLLAHKEFINAHLANNFVLFKPKDIVSGDFYWATSVNSATENLFYLAVCDSTGHGVPGAFMSLLNINFLNEAINEKGIKAPNEVFNYVRKRLVESISKDGQRDGFDGILVCFNKTDNTITYSAANNAPVLIRNNSLVTLPYNKMPVGLGETDASFDLFNIEYKNNDVVYIYTDGYADQFGGPKGKKFKYKQLNEKLLEHSGKPLTEQQLILKNTFEEWQGNLEQVDDVCIIGIRL